MSRFDKRKTGKWIAAAAAAALIAGSAGAMLWTEPDGGEVRAAEKDDATEDVLTDVMEQQLVSHSAEAGKEETVYVIAGSDGSSRQVIVSSWLKNAEGSDTLADATTLTDIENVKGTQTYTAGSGSEIIWQAEGSDIYYQGTTDRELPVEMRLTYYLDGEEISPQELAGKSGHVTIRFDYDNHAVQTATIGGKEEEITVPFAVVSGVILPLDRFSNVSVSNGKILSEGNNDIVVGLAFPGFSDNLSVSEEEKEALAENGVETDALEIEIPDYVEIEADVTDFELAMSLTMMIPDAFSAVKTDGEIDLSGVSEQLATLQDSMTRLSDSSKQLVEGSAQLAEGAQELAAGTLSARDGAYSLASGMQQLSEGGKAVAGGVQQLAGTLSSMMQQLAPAHDGYAQFEQAVGQMMAGYGMTKEQAVASVMQAQGMTQNELTYLAALSGIYDGLAANAKDLTALVQGAGDLSSGIDTAGQGAWNLYDGLNTLQEGANALSEGSGALYAGISWFDKEGIQELAAAAAGINTADMTGVAERLRAVLDAADSYHTFSGAPEGVESSVKFIIRTEAIR